MVIIVADTGAVLSLALSGLFDVCKKHFRMTKKDFMNAVNSMFKKREWDENLIYLVAKSMLEEY